MIMKIKKKRIIQLERLNRFFIPFQKYKYERLVITMDITQLDNLVSFINSID